MKFTSIVRTCKDRLRRLSAPMQALLLWFLALFTAFPFCIYTVSLSWVLAASLSEYVETLLSVFISALIIILGQFNFAKKFFARHRHIKTVLFCLLVAHLVLIPLSNALLARVPIVHNISSVLKDVSLGLIAWIIDSKIGANNPPSQQ